MGLLRKSLWLASAGTIQPHSRRERRHLQVIAAVQGKPERTVRRAGGRADVKGALGITPDPKRDEAAQAAEFRARHVPASREYQARHARKRA